MVPPEAPRTIIDKLTSKLQKGQRINYEIMTLPGAGHLIEVPNSPPVILSNHVLFPRNQVHMGGTNVDLHSKGQLKAWHKLLDFFTESLN